METKVEAEVRIRVAVVEDHPVVRLAIELALAQDSTLRQGVSVGSGEELIAALGRNPCQVAVCDYVLEGAGPSGIVLLRRLRRCFPDVSIVLLTGMDNPAMLAHLVAVGFDVIVSKCDPLQHVVSAIHSAHSRRAFYSPSVEAIVRRVRRPGRGRVNGFARLSPREREVCRYFAEGMGTTDIAAHVGRNKQTVSTQKASALAKLGARSDADFFMLLSQVGVDAVLR